ncbi:MAG: acyl carrier protein [Christensenellales bacterium]
MSFEKVKKIIAKNLSVDESKVTMESDFVADLGADSIDLVEIYMDLEDEYKMSIPDNELPNIKTVGDLVNFVDSKIKK